MFIVYVIALVIFQIKTKIIVSNASVKSQNNAKENNSVFN